MARPRSFIGEAHDEHVLSLMAFKWRWSLVTDAAHVFLAGTPRRGGVVAAKPGGPMLWARAPLLWGRPLRRRVPPMEQQPLATDTHISIAAPMVRGC